MSKHVHYIDDDSRHLFSGENNCSTAERLKAQGKRTVHKGPPSDNMIWGGNDWGPAPVHVREETISDIKTDSPSFREQLDMLWLWAEARGLQADATPGDDTPGKMLHRVKEIIRRLGEV